MGRALLISFHFPPENLPATLHPRFFAKYLPRFGVEVDVVATSHSPLGYDSMAADADPRVWRAPLAEAPRRRMKTLHGWESFLNWHLKMSDWGRPWIGHGAEAAIALAGRRRYDSMISFSPPFATHRAALRVKRLHPQLPWLAYFADPFVGNPMTASNPLQRRFDARLEAEAFRAADRVIANTEAAEAMWRARYPSLAAKFSHIPNGFDSEEAVGPRAIPAGRAAPVLLHAGALYGARFPHLLLASIDRLTRSGSLARGALQVRLLGETSPLAVAACPPFESLRARGLVALDGAVSREEAIRRAAEADYLLLLDLADSGAALQVPSKLFDYLRIGRPILCYTPGGSETQRILERGGVPFAAVDARADAAQADGRLMEFLRLPTAPRPMSAWARARFDASAMTARLLDIHIHAQQTFCNS